MNKYPAYKASGIEWIGEIPEHWEVILFKRVIDKIKDGTHGTYQRVQEGQPFLSAKNVFDEGLDISSSESKISDEDYHEITKNGFPKKGDLLITCVGTIGRTFVYNLDVPHAFQRSVTFLRLNPFKALPQFYKYYVQSSIYQDFLKSIAKTSAQSGVYMGDLMNSIALLPPLSEQTSIANYLDNKTNLVDTLIVRKQKLVELLKEERTAIINQVVTKGLDPSVPMKDSGVEWLGKFPEHWEVKKIDTLSECITGYAFKSDSFSFDSGVKLVRGDNVTEGKLRWGDKTRYWKEIKPEMEKFLLKEFDVLIGMDGSKVGKNYAMVNASDLPLLLVQRVARIRAKTPIIAKYIAHVISTYNFRYYINLSKTDPAIPHITLKNIKDYKIFLPPLEELQTLINKLETKIKKIDKTVTKTQQEINLLNEYKTALISDVVTGKVDVREEILEETCNSF